MKLNIPTEAQPKNMTPLKPLKPSPHPHQDRLEQYRSIPSLVTTNPENAPKGK